CHSPCFSGYQLSLVTAPCSDNSDVSDWQVNLLRCVCVHSFTCELPAAGARREQGPDPD
ncbi:hypothetical protein GOODEAATRI_030194, partial [Goodea atripinnis]